jgi:hypothetical protein
MVRRFFHSPVALISTAWAILFPLGIDVIGEIVIRQPTSEILLAAIVIGVAMLTGGMLGLPLSYSLAHLYPKMNFSKGVIICLGWATALGIGTLSYVFISTLPNDGQSMMPDDTAILVRSVILGSTVFAGTMLIPGVIGGTFTALVERSLHNPPILQHRTFRVIGAWSLALTIGSAIGYSVLLGLAILLKDHYPNEIFPAWFAGIAFAIVGALSGAIGSSFTFSSRANPVEKGQSGK